MELLEKDDPKEESLVVVDVEKSNNILNFRRLIYIFFVFLAIIFSTIFILTKPSVKFNGAKVEIIEYGNKYIEQGLSVKLRNKDISNTIKIEGEVDSNKLGEYQIKYIIPYMNHSIQYKRKVRVIDSTKPKLEVQVKDKYFMNQHFNRDEFTAIDNVDGDIKSKVEIYGNVDTSKPGSYNIKYKVKDSSGNESEIEKNVIVDDKIGLICLTFDDGPSQNVTPKVLDTLKEKNVKATFFLLNYTDDKIDIVKREIGDGHTIGLHGYSHTYSEIYQSVDTARENIIKIQERVKNTTGFTSKLIRFPGGSSNTISEKYDKGLMTKLTQEMTKEGFKYFDWNASGEDAGSAKNSDDVYNNVINGIKPGRTNVVLLHDFSSNKKMLDVLARIIDETKNQGYDFEAINDKTDSVIHNVKN